MSNRRSLIRRGVILPVVLFVLVMAGLLGAMFAFRVNADLASLQAVIYQTQTRLAAEAGIDRVKLVLRTARFDVNAWYNNPELLHRIVVWSEGKDENAWGTRKEWEDGRPAYRFSIVADDPTDDLERIRFGITDEASKINLNEATESQLFALVANALAENSEVDPQLLVDAILDWRDADSNPRGSDADTEVEYYRQLNKAYRVANGPFSTVEELLLVKGIDTLVLFGEDVDRNGILTPNEDDGDETFPPDDADGRLNRGMYPYLTVFSSEKNVSIDNRKRVYLLGEEKTVKAELAEVFPDEPAVIDFIVKASKPKAGGGKGNVPGGKKDAGGKSPAVPKQPNPTGVQPGTGPNPVTPPANQNPGKQPGDGKPGGKSSKSAKSFPPQESGQPIVPAVPPTNEPQPGGGSGKPGSNTGGGGKPPKSPAQPESDPNAAGGKNPEKPGTKAPGAPGSNNEESGAGPIRSPASLCMDRTIDGKVTKSPLTAEHLAVLLDRTTIHPPKKESIAGLINVNTAPAEVLLTLEPLTGEQVNGIIETRGALSAESKLTPAWLVTEGILDLPTFEKIAPKLTAKAQQFTIEALGFADHVGTVSRIEVVVDMVGPVAQLIQYRDLSQLGGHFPIRKDDDERNGAR